MKKSLLVLAVATIALSLSGCSGIKSQYVKHSEITDISTAKVGILEIQHCQPSYWHSPEANDKISKNIGNDARACQADKRYNDYVKSLADRLVERLGKPITPVPMLSPVPTAYTPAEAAASGRAAGVDYIIGGILFEYGCPGTGAKLGSALISGVTTALSPVAIGVSTKQNVTSKIEIIRTSDGKIMGEILKAAIGYGMMGSCSKLVRDAADEVYEQQFGVPKL